MPTDSNHTVTLTTIAALRTSVLPAVEQIYYVGDRGQEGHFYYDAADLSSSDDLGTVLVNSGGCRYKRIYEQQLNVKWFGAVGDGTADDTDAVQRAIDTAAAGAVYFPIGNYRVTHLATGSRKRFNGDGAILSTKGNAAIFDVQSDDVVIEGMILEGDAAEALPTNSSGQSGIRIDGYANTRIINCEIRKMRGEGIYYSYSPPFGKGIQVVGGLFHGNVTGIRFGIRGEFSSVTAAHIYGNGTGIVISAGNVNINSVNITSNTVGILINKGENDSHGIIRGCHINHNLTYGLFIDSVSNGETISDCHIYENDIYIKDSNNILFVGGIVDPHHYYLESCHGIVFTGVYFPMGYGNQFHSNYKGTHSTVICENNRWGGSGTAGDLLANIRGGYVELALNSAQILQAGRNIIKGSLQRNVTCFNNHDTYNRMYVPETATFAKLGLCGGSIAVQIHMYIDKQPDDVDFGWSCQLWDLTGNRLLGAVPLGKCSPSRLLAAGCIHVHLENQSQFAIMVQMPDGANGSISEQEFRVWADGF